MINNQSIALQLLQVNHFSCQKKKRKKIVDFHFNKKPGQNPKQSEQISPEPEFVKQIINHGNNKKFELYVKDNRNRTLKGRTWILKGKNPNHEERLPNKSRSSNHAYIQQHADSTTTNPSHDLI